eukprot:CAMPEP_0115753750 /NCGR_PEP_ID=MMETSP0272-20121206/96495_1 /TAXON_ID=71861 /ORGANISM="Scrippsiella trochoidea, Strain CCMP3099" /LENGTH=135 /DNA_ID=CAMNT_0003199095 /DNA_START=83 /DNA_END=487 /DNA_ORIENTATION=-
MAALTYVFKKSPSGPRKRNAKTSYGFDKIIWPRSMCAHGRPSADRAKAAAAWGAASPYSTTTEGLGDPEALSCKMMPSLSATAASLLASCCSSLLQLSMSDFGDSIAFLQAQGKTKRSKSGHMDTEMPNAKPGTN